MAVPLTPVEDVLESAVFAIVQGAQPGPPKVTRTLLGSRPVPVIENVKACPPMGGLGVVVIVESWTVGVGVETVRLTPLDCGPVPFCTKTVKVPAAKVAVPVKVVEVAVVSAVVAIVHGVQPGPLNSITTSFGLKPDPVAVKVKACPPTAGVGEVAIELSWNGTARDVTTSGTELEIAEMGPFSTVTLKFPPASIATPSNSVELLFSRTLLAMMQVVEGALHPGPLKTTIALFGSKPLPVMANVNACAAVGGSGETVRELMRGFPVVPDTANVRPDDGVPFAPFCTVTVKLPPPEQMFIVGLHVSVTSVTVPLNCV